MTEEQGTAGYTADMSHSEKSIHLYAARQYDCFQKKRKYLTALLSFLLIVAGLLTGADAWQGALLLLIGCVAVTNLYAAPKHIANAVVKRMNGKFPVIRYGFYADHIDVSTSSVPVYYGGLTLLAEDKDYLYLFLTPQTGYMIDKASVVGRGGYDGLAGMLEQASGMKIQRASGLDVNGLKAMIAKIRKRRKNG